MKPTEALQKRFLEDRELTQFLKTPGGAALLERLEREFYHSPIMAADPYTTAFNCGSREVVSWLRELRDRE